MTNTSSFFKLQEAWISCRHMIKGTLEAKAFIADETWKFAGSYVVDIHGYSAFFLTKNRTWNIAFEPDPDSDYLFKMRNTSIMKEIVFKKDITSSSSRQLFFDIYIPVENEF